MAKAIAKRKRKLDWRHYPNEYKYRGGCKVAWHIYETRKEAEECAEAARHNAVIKESLGYDFGYCSPGSITVLPDGKFEVCVP